MTINAGYVENAPTLAQPGSALFRYAAKMAAVEYEKCTSPHTLTVLSTPSGSFQYTYFRPIWIGTPYVLKLRLVSTDSMDIGTRHLCWTASAGHVTRGAYLGLLAVLTVGGGVIGGAHWLLWAVVLIGKQTNRQTNVNDGGSSPRQLGLKTVHQFAAATDIMSYRLSSWWLNDGLFVPVASNCRTIHY